MALQLAILPKSIASMRTVWVWLRDNWSAIEAVATVVTLVGFGGTAIAYFYRWSSKRMKLAVEQRLEADERLDRMAAELRSAGSNIGGRSDLAGYMLLVLNSSTQRIRSSEHFALVMVVWAAAFVVLMQLTSGTPWCLNAAAWLLSMAFMRRYWRAALQESQWQVGLTNRVYKIWETPLTRRVKSTDPPAREVDGSAQS